jgi:hypothetical protein
MRTSRFRTCCRRQDHRLGGIAATLLLSGLLLQAQSSSYPATPQVLNGDIAVRIDDYATMPPPPNLTGRLSRVTAMRFEPGDAPQFASRAFVADMKGLLYTLDLDTRSFTTYIDFRLVFAKFANDPSFGAGLGSLTFHPEYAQNGKFYTVHTEGPSLPGSMVPSAELLPGLDLSGGYTPTGSIDPPEGSVARQAVIVEWTDTDLANTTFEGTAREVLRVGFSKSHHFIADMIFKPAQSDDPDFANLYLALGDGGADGGEEQADAIPQRLDALPGKVLRITPDVDRRPADMLAANGRYRIPSTGIDPNPFVDLTLPGAKKEIYAYGLRNPQRMSWDAVSDTLIVADIGAHSWEELNVIRNGGNYGYPEREGPEQLFVGGPNDGKTGSQTTPEMPHPQPDTLTVVGLSEPVTPRYPVAVYSHRDGDAVAGGFAYRGTLLPQLYGKYVFGDISTARLFYVDLMELLSADDGDRATRAQVHELQMLFDHPDDSPDRGPVPVRLFDVVADQYVRRGGDTGSEARLPQAADRMSDASDTHGVPYGGGRADIRFAQDRQGELYVLSKSDGMIRKFAAARTGVTTTILGSSPNPSEVGDPVQLHASVAAAAGVPTGSIEFFEGGTLLTTAPLVSGTAAMTTSGLAAGAYVFTARFVPENGTLLGSLGGVTHFAAPPDLVSSLSAVQGAVAPGAKLTFTESTANQGLAGADASTTRYFLSADSEYGGDILIGSRAVVPLASGAQSVGAIALTIPVSTALGQYYLIACADATSAVFELDEQNNCTQSPVTLGRPDLVTTSISTTATAVAPGGTFTVSDTARNHGAVASVLSTTRFYFSADAIKSADDRLLTGNHSVAALAPAASLSVSGTRLTVPAATPLGLWVLLACADDTARNVEVSEANNCAAASGQVRVGRPDLVVTSLSNPPVEIAPGKTFSATTATANQGLASSLSSKTRFYLSEDASKGGFDYLLAVWISVAALTPGQTLSSTKTLTVPVATADGVYRLLACADDTNAMIENDEANNCTVAAGSVQVKRPDLTEGAVSNPPGTVIAGTMFSVTDTVINVGAIASVSTATRYYLSVDTIKTPGDVLLTGGRSVPSLNAGASHTGSKTVTVPSLSPGTYYLLACADDGAVAIESREDNNCRPSATTTIVP